MKYSYEYAVVRSTNVAGMLNDGWELQGSPVLDKHDNAFQAMIKKTLIPTSRKTLKNDTKDKE